MLRERERERALGIHSHQHTCVCDLLCDLLCAVVWCEVVWYGVLCAVLCRVVWCEVVWYGMQCAVFGVCMCVVLCAWDYLHVCVHIHASVHMCMLAHTCMYIWFEIYFMKFDTPIFTYYRNDLDDSHECCFLSEKHLVFVSERIGEGWKNIVRSLDIKEYVVEQLDSDHKGVREKAYQGLTECIRQAQHQPAHCWLLEVLGSIDRNDIIQDLTEKFAEIRSKSEY